MNLLLLITSVQGYCGSSCDTFSRTAWWHARSNPKGPSFKYVTYGGTGSPKITPTSFQGGNVESNEGLTQLWGYYAMALAASEWSGAPEVVAAVGVFLPLRAAVD